MGTIKKHGIDISSWQGDINLTPYKDQFVIIRAGYDITRDTKAVRNMNECEKLGIPYGVYWYSYALSTAQAKAEAKACLNAIRNRNISVGVWFDMEDADSYKRKNGFKFTKDNISAICNEFCKIVEAEGYYTGIYASRSWIDTYINCPKYDKWVAQWGINNGKINADTSSIGSLLQYTSKPLDKNVSYVDLSRFKTKKTEEVQVEKPKESVVVDGIEGTQTIKALQKLLNQEDNAGLVVDGIKGAQTIKALQRYINKRLK